jgi:hypothetical protein
MDIYQTVTLNDGTVVPALAFGCGKSDCHAGQVVDAEM